MHLTTYSGHYFCSVASPRLNMRDWRWRRAVGWHEFARALAAGVCAGDGIGGDSNTTSEPYLAYTTTRAPASSSDRETSQYTRTSQRYVRLCIVSSEPAIMLCVWCFRRCARRRATTRVETCTLAPHQEGATRATNSRARGYILAHTSALTYPCKLASCSCNEPTKQ